MFCLVVMFVNGIKSLSKGSAGRGNFYTLKFLEIQIIGSYLQIWNEGIGKVITCPGKRHING